MYFKSKDITLLTKVHIVKAMVFPVVMYRCEWSEVKWSEVTQSCLTLCDPMDYSMPGFPVYHHLPELAQTHVHLVSDAIQPSHPLSSFSSCLQPFPASGSCPMSRLFTSGGQSIGVSASASVLPMKIQGWFPLGLTGFISLLFKRLSSIFSSTQFESISSSN